MNIDIFDALFPLNSSKCKVYSQFKEGAKYSIAHLRTLIFLPFRPQNELLRLFWNVQEKSQCYIH